MDEKRQFFRIHNNGIIQASCDEHPLEVIEISSSGVAIIKENDNVPKKGILHLNIGNNPLKISYELLRVEQKTMVLVFKLKREIDQLFVFLKKIKDGHL